MNTAQPTQDAYIPGVCNINTKEIAYRRKFAIGGCVLAAVMLIALVAMDANRFMRLIIFLPLLIGVVGIFQVRNKFCVSLGASGLQNAQEGSTEALPVADDAARKKDKAKASNMNRKAFAISLVITLLALAIPQ